MQVHTQHDAGAGSSPLERGAPWNGAGCGHVVTGASRITPAGFPATSS